MKLKCTQCGAFIAVTSPDAYVNCLYCGARAVVAGFTGESYLHRPVLSKQDAVRLFPVGAVASVSIYWFPYDPDSLVAVFTQPYPEMENYLPPAADRRIWEEQSAVGNVIPVDPDLIGEQGVIYHPFWVVIASPSGQGFIVDAVSGKIVSATPEPSGKKKFDPFYWAFRAFGLGLLPALLVFFLFRNFSIFWASVMGMAAAVYAPGLWNRIRGEKSE